MKPIAFKKAFPMDIVSVQGKPYMFTNMRIDRDTVPDGFFAYDVRDDCDGEFWQIQRHVLVNHWGTIIGIFPVVLNENGQYNCASTRDNDDFSEEGNFIGERVKSEAKYLKRLEEFSQMCRWEYIVDNSEAILTLSDDRMKVSIDNIGEGLHGDYCPDDPDDVNLLRFWVEYRPTDLSGWEEVEDASYCTLLRATTPFDELLEKLKVIWNRYRSVIDQYPEVSLKKLGEELSWISS